MKPRQPNAKLKTDSKTSARTPLVVHVVTKAAEVKTFDRRMADQHYLGSTRPVGDFLRQVVEERAGFGDEAVEPGGGALSDGQVGWNRPFEGAGSYRTPLAGLYLCGSSSHPGGNVTGLPGYNCAQVLLEDLGLPAPWAPPRFGA